jgi:hypothetical protein
MELLLEVALIHNPGMFRIAILFHEAVILSLHVGCPSMVAIEDWTAFLIRVSMFHGVVINSHVGCPSIRTIEDWTALMIPLTMLHEVVVISITVSCPRSMA